MYGVNQYHLDQDVPVGKTLSCELYYHGPPHCEEYNGEEGGDN